MSCQNNSFCSEDDVLRFCYDDGICDCSNWFGWTGDNCDQPSSTLYYSRVSVFLLLILYTVLSLMTLRTLTLYLKHYFKLENRKEEKLDPVFYLLVFVLLSCVLFVISLALRVPALFDSTHFQFFELKSLLFDTEERVQSKTGAISNRIIIGASIIIFIAGTQIILSWIKVIIMFTQIFPTEYGCFPIEKVAKIFRYLLPPILLLAGLIIAVDLPTETVFLYIFFVLTLISIYAYGFFSVVRILKLLPKGDPVKREVIGRVRSTYRINFIGCVAVLVLSGMYYVANILYDDADVGSFNYALLIFDLDLLAGLFILANFSFYSHGVTVRLLNIEKSTPWFPAGGSVKLKSKSKESSLDFNRIVSDEKKQTGDTLRDSI